MVLKKNFCIEYCSLIPPAPLLFIKKRINNNNSNKNKMNNR